MKSISQKDIRKNLLKDHAFTKIYVSTKYIFLKKFRVNSLNLKKKLLDLLLKDSSLLLKELFLLACFTIKKNSQNLYFVFKKTKNLCNKPVQFQL